MGSGDVASKQAGESGHQSMKQHPEERDVDTEQLIDEAQRSAREHEEKRRTGEEKT